MKRELYNKLIAWKNNPNRKPLVLQGARQTGKTFLVTEFGKKEYKNFIYLDFEKDKNLVSLFSDLLSPQEVLSNISFYTSKAINSKDTLLFFDEIQVAPRVLTALKYFKEEASEYHVIAAGSLLGVSVNKSSSFPVGKVNFLQLHPMSFGEFLMALGEEIMFDKLKSIKNPESLPEAIHAKLLKYFKIYLFVGGMPETVKSYIEEGDVSKVRTIQKELLEAYKKDFSKYASKEQSVKISELWFSIPRQLAKENKKFKYNTVRKNARASYYEQTIEWMKGAGLINVTYNVTSAKLPLSGYSDLSKFKIYLFDTGLLGAMLNLSSRIIIEPDTLFREYNGAFIENYVAQELTFEGHAPLFYWTSKSDAEVDFVIEHENTVFPVEVKSGSNLHAKSLQSYSEKYNPKMKFRISPRNFILSNSFTNLPLYGVSSIKNIIESQS